MENRFSISKTILKGLIVLLPLTILIVSVTWFVSTLEIWLSKFSSVLLPQQFHFPGMGFVFALVISFVVGLLMNTRVAQKLYGLFEHLVERIPLIKSLYGAVQDILGLFSTDRKRRYNRVVIVRFKEAQVRLVGFVTQEDLNQLRIEDPKNESIAVYLPMSYQIGGYMIFVPKTMIEPVNMSIEDASRMVLTAGMSASFKSDRP